MSSMQALLHYYDKATGRKSKKPPQYAKKGQVSFRSYFVNKLINITFRPKDCCTH
jgi:hypothetical protein